MQSTSSSAGVMKMRKVTHLVALHGLEDIVGLGIRITVVSVRMISVTEISEAEEDSSFVRVMRMNQRFCFVMLFDTRTHTIGLFHLIVFGGRTPDVLTQKNTEIGVLKQTMKTKCQRYLWHDKLLD